MCDKLPQKCKTNKEIYTLDESISAGKCREEKHPIGENEEGGQPR